MDRWRVRIIPLPPAASSAHPYGRGGGENDDGPGGPGHAPSHHHQQQHPSAPSAVLGAGGGGFFGGGAGAPDGYGPGAGDAAAVDKTWSNYFGVGVDAKVRNDSSSTGIDSRILKARNARTV